MALYARVSSEEQAQGYSIDAQLDKLRAYADSQGHQVAAEYVDAGYSGAIKDRPQLEQLLHHVWHFPVELISHNQSSLSEMFCLHPIKTRREDQFLYGFFIELRHRCWIRRTT